MGSPAREGHSSWASILEWLVNSFESSEDAKDRRVSTDGDGRILPKGVADRRDRPVISAARRGSRVDLVDFPFENTRGRRPSQDGGRKRATEIK